MYQHYQDGWIETISGCMFAGKTEELIRRIKVLEFAKKEIMVFKPVIDNRYSETKVVSHAGSSVESYVIQDAIEILDMVKPSTQVVAIDEVQFFDEGVIDIIDELANKGVRVIVGGLEPFGPMGKLICEAEFVTKLAAVCNKCGAPATRTQRIINGKPASYYEPVILVGAAESYEARCRHCHEVPDKPIVELVK